MNPIIINLLAREEQAEQARARDPVKVLIVISTLLLAIVVGIGGVLFGLALHSGVDLKGLEHRRTELEKQQTSGNIGAFLALKQWSGDLLEINQARRLFAPQLALIKDLVPDCIQLSRLTLATTAVVRAPTGPTPEGMDDVKAKIASRAPPASQVVVLQLEGKVISPHPEDAMASFRRDLETNGTFGAQIQQVKLRSYMRVSSPTERGGSVVGQFVLECQYKEQK